MQVVVTSGDPGDDDGVTARTVVVGDGGVGPTHVQLSTRAVERLTPEGLRVILTHECVHVALATRPRPTPPMWLLEGAAEVVAYAGSEVSESVATAPLIGRVTAGGPPRRLPSDADFEPATSDREGLRLAYMKAHTAARVYADRHGMAALIRLVTDGPGPGGYARVEAEVLPAWQAELRRQAGGRTPPRRQP